MTVNHILTAGIMSLLIATSPMSISMYYGNTTPTVATFATPAN